MSQRRQEARRADQERRRQQRREARVQQRRARQASGGTSTAKRVGVAGAAGAATSTAATTKAVAPRKTRDNRKLYIVGGIVGGLLLLALIVWLVSSLNEPLPGVGYPTNGNSHVALGQPHGSYFSNPPTSGWHTDPIPNPGIYTNPKQPEELGHFMEHGGVWVLYTCDQPCPELAEQLAAVVNAAIDKNRPVALAPYPPPNTPERTYDRPEHRINVIAWQRMLSLNEFDKKQISNFIERLACNYNPESAGWCGRVRGTIAKEPVDAGAAGFNRIDTQITNFPASSSGASAPMPPAAAPTPAAPGPTPPPAASPTPTP